MAIERGIIDRAVQQEIVLWRETTNRIISNSKLPPLPNDDPILKSAIWFNFGLDAGKNLSLAISTAASRAALPIWAAFKAQELYSKYYKHGQDVIDYNRLGNTYDSFKSELQNMVNHAERAFFLQKKTIATIDHLEQLFSKNQNFGGPNTTNHEKLFAVRDLLKESGIVQTNPDALKKIIRGNLKQVANNIIAIYQGTHRAGGTNLLYIANDIPAAVSKGMPFIKTQRAASGRGHHTSASCSNRVVTRATPKGYSLLDTRDPQAMKKLYANAYRFNIKHKDFLWLEPCYDTTYVRSNTMGQPQVLTDILQSARSANAKLTETYHQLYRSTQATAHAI
ncbi:MAG: hypothetical protein ACRBBR_05610 [Cellvibrionaceae bacterium]